MMLIVQPSWTGLLLRVGAQPSETGEVLQFRVAELLGLASTDFVLKNESAHRVVNLEFTLDEQGIRDDSNLAACRINYLSRRPRDFGRKTHSSASPHKEACW